MGRPVDRARVGRVVGTLDGVGVLGTPPATSGPARRVELVVVEGTLGLSLGWVAVGRTAAPTTASS